MTENKVNLINVRNRDGVQTSRILLPKLSKIMFNIYLDQFESDREARRILDRVQHASLHSQKPLADDELRFIAFYPDNAQKILQLRF